MRPAWLTGEQVYLRAMLAGDKDVVSAWFPDPYPVSPERAEQLLREWITNPWQERQYLAICRTSDDEVVGSTRLVIWGRIGRVRFKMGPLVPDAEALQAEALTLLVPWMRDEMELIATTFTFASDLAQVVAAAERSGLVFGARLREFVARPGHRVDLLLYDALNPRYVRSDGREPAHA
jgi:RimJ/RimL family protein N-acetyltransferase